MTRRRAWAAAAITALGIAAYIAGGVVWLAGVALLGLSYIVLVASQ